MGPVTKVKNVKPSKSAKSSSPKSKINAKKKLPKRISSKPGLKKIVKVQKRKFDPIKANRGVVYIKHIPHGFYEEQMQKYFEQFGNVTRVRVGRSERTGRSKGYGFVEFKVPEVAKIAAETMDNYMMFKQVLKTVYIPPEQQKTNYFRQDVRFTINGQGVRTFTSPKVERIKKQVENINRIKTDDEHEKKIEQAKYKLKKQSEKYGLDLSSCLYNGGDSSDGIKSCKKETKSVKKKNKSDKKVNKKAEKKKKISSSNDGKSLLHQLANETFEEDDSSDDDFKIDSSDEINTTGENETTFGEHETTFGEINASSDEETINFEKKVERKKKIPLSNDDGKSLLYKLVNETFDENDSSDDEFKIDHSFSASDDESASSDANGTSFVDLLASKLNAAHSRIKSNKQKFNKKPGVPETSVLVSKAENKKTTAKKEKNLKKAVKPNNSKQSGTDEVKHESASEKVNIGGKRKRDAQASTSLANAVLNEVLTNGKNKKSKQMKTKEAEGDTEIVKTSDEQQKRPVSQGKTNGKNQKSKQMKTKEAEGDKEIVKTSDEQQKRPVSQGKTNGKNQKSKQMKTKEAEGNEEILKTVDDQQKRPVSEGKTNGKNRKAKQVKTKEAEADEEIVVPSGEDKKRKLNLNSLMSKVNSITEADKAKQKKTKNIDVKKVKSGIVKKKVEVKGQKKNDQKKMVKETPMELLTAWKKLAKPDKVKKSK